MQLRYDEDFIEASVFLCASGRRKSEQPFASPATKGCSPHPLQIARFHREREKLYSILDPDERNTAFFKLHLDWFREWGLEQPLTGMLNEFPLMREQLDVLAVRKTSGKNDAGAELYVNEANQRTGLLALRPEWIATGSAAFKPPQRETADGIGFVPEPSESRTLKRAEARAPLTIMDFLRHEFTHLHDMLNPAFGYSPELALAGLNAAQKRLARERYRLLWDITIDGRLALAGHTPVQTHAQHAEAFARGYSFWPEQQQAEAFDALWRNSNPRHTDFLGLIADPRGLRQAHRPAPGASCPLCDFPTFNWADANALSPEVIERIVIEFPAWSPEQGFCNRCRETYEAVCHAPV
ncbi:MAG TPA: hypothetical protein VFZ59_26625 [Verrucomicrobiae bacterium]|nr:hypothetical protein [Verrucomicrobiae bacterium]